MTPTAQEVAEQLVAQLCTVLVGVHPQATGKKMLPIIADVLTTFAQARERAVWEEAARIATTGRFHFPSIAEEFRQKGTESNHAV